MEQIDWSKAPEGATHYLPRGVAGNNACWYIIRGNDMAAMRAGVDNDDWTWRRIDEHDREHFIPAAIPRPTTWNGEGLPPVGTECEIHGHVHHELRKQQFEWVQCVVIAHTDFGGDQVAVAKTADNSIGWGIGRAFRPIRTPEQIAAEEREKAVDALCSTIVAHYEAPKMSEHYLGLARTLYDAGYRKVEPK